jgi:hypothetical protein
MAVGAGDVWAVGGSFTRGADRPFAAHWDGTAWKPAGVPDVPGGRLQSVVRAGDGRVWAFGAKGAVSLAMSLDPSGHGWRRAPDPDIVIRGVAVTPGGPGIWAVGIAKQSDLTPFITRYQR